MNLKRTSFVVGIVTFVYFTVYFSWYYSGEKLPVFAGAVHELLTLPLALSAVIFLIISTRMVIREGFNTGSVALYAFILLLLVVGFLTVMTIYDPTRPAP